MSNKTLVPAIRCWSAGGTYYVCKMKAGEVARRVHTADDETEGLSRQPDDPGAAGALSAGQIVAECEGNPMFTHFENCEDDLPDYEYGFGVLTLDGVDSFVAVEGLTALNSLKAELRRNRRAYEHDVCVIFRGSQRRREATAKDEYSDKGRAQH